MKKSTLLFLSSMAVFALWSCGDGEKNEEIESVDTVKTEEPKVNPVSETFFQVPSPGEMLTFIKMVGGKNNKNTSFLNPASKHLILTHTIAHYSCLMRHFSLFKTAERRFLMFL